MNFSEKELENLLRRSNGNVRVAQDFGGRNENGRKVNTNTATTKENAPKSKYRAVKVKTDEGAFDSKKELSRWRKLQMLERAGQISNLKRQVPFELIPSVILKGKKQRPIIYKADFTYFENGKLIVEDSKGFRTTEYKIKSKMMKFFHNIEVLET